MKTLKNWITSRRTNTESEESLDVETVVEYQFRDAETGRWRNIKTEELSEEQLCDRLVSYASAGIELRMRRLTEYEPVELAVAH